MTGDDNWAECWHCEAEVPETEGWIGGDGHFLCDDCDTAINEPDP